MKTNYTSKYFNYDKLQKNMIKTIFISNIFGKKITKINILIKINLASFGKMRKTPACRHI